MGWNIWSNTLDRKIDPIDPLEFFSEDLWKFKCIALLCLSYGKLDEESGSNQKCLSVNSQQPYEKIEGIDCMPSFENWVAI